MKTEVTTLIAIVILSAGFIGLGAWWTERDIDVPSKPTLKKQHTSPAEPIQYKDPIAATLSKIASKKTASTDSAIK